MRVLLLAIALCLSLPVVAEDMKRLTIGYVGLIDDPRHAEFRGYANIVLRQAADPYLGAQTAISESSVLARALGVDIELKRTRADDAARMIETIREQAAEGTRLILLDAPGPVIAEVAKGIRNLDVLLFNVTSPDDGLRREVCQPNLLHTFPSRAMLADALVQFAVSSNWDDVLVLHGEEREDQAQVDAFQRAARRFGLEIVDVRRLEAGNDPRNRERNNVVLLTRGDYDVIYVADAAAALGRYIPYRSKHPRPVIGDQGLMPSAWHWSAERYGAPQLNQRFEREAERKMNGKDWAAWAALRAIVDAVRATRATDFNAMRAYLRSEATNLDTYKGMPGSFRSWNGQLRQPILLHTENAVLGHAPFEGFLHPTHELDTLGEDRPESACE